MSTKFTHTRSDDHEATHDAVTWKAQWKVEKRFDGTPADAPPDEVHVHDGNLLMYGGASCLWQTLIGNGTATSGQTLTYFNNGNAYIGVGDSSTAAAATQTDLQASSNKTRKAQDTSYPSHTDGVTSGAATITFKSTFGTSDANYAWNEVAVFNASTGGRMLNRLVQSFGTKSSGSWSMSLAISLS